MLLSLIFSMDAETSPANWKLLAEIFSRGWRVTRAGYHIFFIKPRARK